MKNLTTDENGEVNLGKLDRITKVNLRADVASSG